MPWAHRTRLQQLLLLVLTNNVSNKSGNLLFAQSYPEQYENVRFVHSWCTLEFHQKSYRVNPSLRQSCVSHPASKGIALVDAHISLRRTSSSPPLKFSGILVGTLFRSLRANDSPAPSADDTGGSLQDAAASTISYQSPIPSVSDHARPQWEILEFRVSSSGAGCDLMATTFKLIR
jgi:hypothetical protein